MNKVFLEDYMGCETTKLEHENKKLKWSTLPNGNYLLSNMSIVRPIRYEFSPTVKVREVVTNTRLGDFVTVSTVKSRRLTFKLVRL